MGTDRDALPAHRSVDTERERAPASPQESVACQLTATALIRRRDGTPTLRLLFQSPDAAMHFDLTLERLTALVQAFEAHDEQAGPSPH